MIGKLVAIARQALTLGLIELLVPGGTLVVLALLLTGRSGHAIPARVATLLPFLKLARRPYTPPTGLVVASLASRVPRAVSPRFDRPVAGPTLRPRRPADGRF